MTIVEILAVPFLVFGAFFCVISGIGIYRLPDFYTRSHAAGIGDTMGAPLIIFGLMILAGPTLIGVKLVFVLGFVLITSPIACHALVKAAYSRGVVADAD